MAAAQIMTAAAVGKEKAAVTETVTETVAVKEIITAKENAAKREEETAAVTEDRKPDHLRPLRILVAVRKILGNRCCKFQWLFCNRMWKGKTVGVKCLPFYHVQICIRVIKLVA